jgi:hypothetical protein
VTFTCVVLLISTRGQGCSCAPGIPCALVIEGQCFRQDPGTISAAGTRSRILRAVCHSNRIIKTTACIVMPAPRFIRLVMPALVAGIHVLLPRNALSPWMAGTRPGHDEGGAALTRPRAARMWSQIRTAVWKVNSDRSLPLAAIDSAVMPALVAGIHVLLPRNALSPWMAGTRPGHDDEGQARLYLALSRRGVIVLFDFNMTVETTVVHPPRHARARRGHPRS